jgi:adenylate cyclase
MGNFLTELKRRNVIRVGAAYLVVAWLIAQVAELALDSFDAPSWVIKTVLLLLALGLPAALLFAWAFELTPDGLKKEKDVDRSRSIAPQTGQRLNRLTTVALFLALAFIAWDKLVQHDEPQDAGVVIKSVAVLPFADLSENQDQEWFADGLTEEILNSLARLPELKVTARTSSFEFKNANIDISEIADNLGVAHVVEGSVRRIGDRLRVTAQLIRASDGFHLWSDTYDRSTDDLFDVQHNVAENIALSLDVFLDDDKRQRMFSTGTHDVAAFEAYLKGVELFDSAHSRDTREITTLADANEYFDEALRLDPGFAAAALLHSDRFGHYLLEYDTSEISGRASELDESMARDTLLADFRIAVDNAPDPVARIYAELNFVIFSSAWHRLPVLVAELRTLVASGTRMPLVSLWADEVLMLMGEFDLLESILRERMQTDPLNRNLMRDLANLYLVRGDYGAARATLDETRRQFGDWPRLWDIEVRMALLEKDYPTALRLLESGPDLSGDFRFFVPVLHILRGEEDEARRLVAEIDMGASTANIASAMLGDMDRVRSSLARMDQTPSGPTSLAMDLVYFSRLVSFDTSVTPNLNRRLAEADIDISHLLKTD